MKSRAESLRHEYKWHDINVTWNTNAVKNKWDLKILVYQKWQIIE